MSKKLILASSSPRRRDLLSSLGIEFEVVPANVQETPTTHEIAKDFALRVAGKKALAVGGKYAYAWVIGADTVVTIEDKILGKPQNSEEAKMMLQQLANKEHIVITGYVLFNSEERKKIERVEETRVKIKHLEEKEINWYINTGEPFDKAGGYAIQGKGNFLVEWIQGSYTNVVGLPLCQLVELLNDLEIIDIF